MRTNRQLLHFIGAFELAGFPDPLPAGAYEISTMDEETDTMLTQGWRRVSTLLRTPSADQPTGMEQWTEVHPDDVDRALAHDAELNPTVTSIYARPTVKLDGESVNRPDADENSIKAQQARLQSDGKHDS